MTDCQRDDEVALHQFEVEGEPKVTSGKGVFGGLFLNKTKLIILAVIILILLIIIIVLATVLGHKRSKDRGVITGVLPDKKGKEEEVGPPSIGPTTPVSHTRRPTRIHTRLHTRFPTTPVSLPHPSPDYIRLPENVKPYHYDLTLYIDLNEPHFKGAVDIWVDVSSSTPYILLHTRSMNFTRIEVRKVSGGSIPIKQHFNFEKNQSLVIELESALDKGKYITKVDFSGEYADDLRGMYKSYFYYPNGTESFYSATQFQPLEARKAFPCFDEPAMKATFNVTLVHDPRLIALSNMPIYKSEVKDGWKHDHFEKTVKMSTYLAAFFVGDFKYKETKTDKGVVIRIYARGEVLDEVDYALAVTNQTLTFFEEFFGVPYTLPKLDAVALRAFRYGGMENWGLIIYRDTIVLFKPGETTTSSKDSIAKVVAHEVGHQWFGNIVTMKWWSDLWLNEGFATYVAAIGIDHIHPEWNIVDQFIARDVQNSLALDGLSSSHKIRIPVNDPQKIMEIFDDISYKKGGSILLMLHSSLGDTIFRDGLKRYLTKHALGNADTEDLWDAMTEASQAAGKATDVRKMMDTFTLQMGYPVVTIKKSTSKSNTYVATQDRFLYYRDPSANYSNSPYGYKWVIPFSYYSGTRKTPPSNTVLKMMDSGSVEISWNGNGWIKGNVGQTGFYRVNYDDRNWIELAIQLYANHKVLSTTDRAGLIDDSFNLARANLLNHTKPLRLSMYLIKEQDYVPLLVAARTFSAIMKILPSDRPAYKYLQRYVQHLTKSQYDALGINPQGTFLERLKKTLLINTNCAAGKSTCLGNMTQMFQQWMKDPLNNAIPADLKAPVYHFGVVTGGEKEWDFVFNQFTRTYVESDVRILLYAMAGAQKPWLIERYLNYTLDRSKIGPYYMYNVMYYIADSNAMGTDIAWNFFQLKWEKISKMLGGPYSILPWLVPFLSKRFSTEYQLQQLQDLIINVMKNEPLPWSLQQAIEKVKVNVQWRKTHEKDVETWLSDFFNQPKQPDFGPPAK